MKLDDAIEQASWTPMAPPSAPGTVTKAWKGQGQGPTSDWSFVVVTWKTDDEGSGADGTASSFKQGLIVRLLPAQAERAAELAGILKENTP